jgi:hypothetical protein
MNINGWDIPSTIFETYELILMMFKRRIQNVVTSSVTLNFLKDFEDLSYNLLRSSLCSLNSLKILPTDRVCSLIQHSLAYTAL